MKKENTFDVVVIGAGPAGYVAAIRCAQLGLKTACVDDWVNPAGDYVLGGTCLNVGCIPSKALLDSSEQYYRIAHHIGEHGIHVDNLQLDVPAMINRKQSVVKKLTGGIAALFQKNKVTWVKGHGKLAPDLKVEVENKDGEQRTLQASHIIIATGSAPRSLKNIKQDDEYIVDSAGALEFQDVPGRLGVIGAGVIGLELGSVWKRLGSEVTLLEATEQFLFFADEEVGKVMFKELSDQELDIRLNTRVLSAKTKKGVVHVEYEDQDGKHKAEFDRLVVAVGRRPNTDRLGLERIELLSDERGFIHVNEHCRTNLPNIYAVGDVVGGAMLAHKGSEEGIMVAERIAGQKTEVNHDTIPMVIYTMPEVAWVGKTEKELSVQGVKYKVGRFPMKANGRALATDHAAGFVKVLADSETDEILGVHVVAAAASEIIAEAVVAMEYAASAEDLARIVHAHPTLSEAVHEAALDVADRTIHM